MRTRRIILLSLLAMVRLQGVSAQRSVSLPEAIDAALSRGPRIAIARADSAAGVGRLISARAWPNPDLALGYSKDPPHFHAELEQAFEYPGVRSARRRAAQAGAQAANLTLAAERAAVRYEIEVAYTHAAAARSIERLAERNARNAAELLRITQARQNAGDASELDVRLAAVVAGQTQLEAFTDSLETITAALEVQALMGLPDTDLQITLSDSLESITPATAASTRTLRVTAAEQQLQSEQASLQLARRSRIPAPALRTGFETGGPSEDDNRILPTLGIALPLPIWNRHRGEIAEARAQVARATAELDLVRLETRSALAIAEQQRAVAILKVERGRAIVQEAERVAVLATTAYREGAYTLAAVLEAQRDARNALRQFIQDLEASRLAQAALTRAQIVGGAKP